MATTVLPGTILGQTSKAIVGAGTHISNGTIVSSVLGQASSTPASKQSNASSSSKQSAILSVLRPRAAAQSLPTLPAVGAQVYAKVIAVQRLQALCEIRVICPPQRTALPSLSSSSSGIDAANSTTQQMHPLATPFRGILRAQDVRATEKDKVKLSECFGVGDIVRAVVISLGDQGGYYLSTAGNEYGVIMAWSEGAGNLCVPVSWCEVVDSVTGAKESRKVAKPI